MTDLFEGRLDLKIKVPTREELDATDADGQYIIKPVKRDIWYAILQDSWMWIVVWGKPRTGKTTLLLDAAYAIYQDWDLVLQACFFNLNGFLYKMKKGEPCRLLSLNGLHFRVPILLADDFGAQCNKAKIQHEPAWDIVKGAWDTLATKVGVLMGSMGTPSGATQQLQEKYTHEIYVDSRGHGKYDQVNWQQDYYGWRANQKKGCLWDFTFDNLVPVDIYKRYDEMRMSLVDDLIQQIEDSQIENEGIKTLNRLNQKDIDLIELLYTKGTFSNDWLHKPENEHWIEAFKRLRGRGLILPVLHGTAYWYDITDFGLSVYQLVQMREKKGQFAPEELSIKPSNL